MKTCFMLMILALGSVIFSHGAMVENGVKLEVVKNAMREAGYEETALQMGPKNAKLAFWAVDEGILIVRHTVTTKRVLSISFWWADDRGKSQRNEVSLGLKSFDTATGLMVVQTKKPG